MSGKFLRNIHKFNGGMHIYYKEKSTFTHHNKYTHVVTATANGFIVIVGKIWSSGEYMRLCRSLDIFSN